MRLKVVANAHLGHLDEARAELSRMLGIEPKPTVAGIRAYAHFPCTNSPGVDMPMVNWLLAAGTLGAVIIFGSQPSRTGKRPKWPISAYIASAPVTVRKAAPSTAKPMPGPAWSR
jgi:hypothetical protein